MCVISFIERVDIIIVHGLANIIRGGVSRRDETENGGETE